MGLGAPKSRNKLSHDPNNTAWARDTDGYGHRILASQGWKQGDYLGADNASHADHYTAANASHIRVLLREDNLGLGAKVGGKANAETFGLSTLSGIFGRLNGKSDVDLAKQQSNLRDAELRTYQAQKYGFMNFVRGGLLVGDKIEEIQDQKVAAKTVDSKSASAGAGEEGKVSKKRKAGEIVPESAVGDGSRKKSKKQKSAVEDNIEPAVHRGKLKKRKERREEDTPFQAEPTASTGATSPRVDAEKAAKRERKEARKAKRAAGETAEAPIGDEKARLKQEKRAGKEERRRRKEEKRKAKAAESSDDDEPLTSTTTTASTTLPTPVASEVNSGTSTPTPGALAFGGRRGAIRQRYIMQKRMASMDPKALNEILMIKAQG